MTFALLALIVVVAVAGYREHRQSGELRYLREKVEFSNQDAEALRVELVAADRTARYWRNAVQQLHSEIDRISFDQDLNEAAVKQIETLAQAINKIEEGAPQP